MSFLKLNRAPRPSEAITLLYQTGTIVFIHIPWWILSAIPTSNRPRPTWTITRTVYVKLIKHLSATIKLGSDLFQWPDYHALLPEYEGVWINPVPGLVTGQVQRWADAANVKPIRIPGYWLRKERNSQGGQKVLYHLHGGGYAAQSANPGDLTASIPRGILEHSELFEGAFMLEYRLSKEMHNDGTNPFPAALIDAIMGYYYLVHDLGIAPKDIVLGGDSAGGNLALALVRYLIENHGYTFSGGTIPSPPSGLVLNSPWVDLGLTEVDKVGSVYSNIPSDIINVSPLTIVDDTRTTFLGPISRAEATRCAYLSPGAPLAEPDMDISFKGFPRTFISAGGAEVLRDEIRVLKWRMVRDLGERMVEYVEMPDAIHDFLLFDWHEPERSLVLERIAEWLKEE